MRRAAKDEGQLHCVEIGKAAKAKARKPSRSERVRPRCFRRRLHTHRFPLPTQIPQIRAVNTIELHWLAERRRRDAVLRGSEARPALRSRCFNPGTEREESSRGTPLACWLSNALSQTKTVLVTPLLLCVPSGTLSSSPSSPPSLRYLAPPTPSSSFKMPSLKRLLSAFALVVLALAPVAQAGILLQGEPPLPALPPPLARAHSQLIIPSLSPSSASQGASSCTARRRSRRSTRTRRPSRSARPSRAKGRRRASSAPRSPPQRRRGVQQARTTTRRTRSSSVTSPRRTSARASPRARSPAAPCSLALSSATAAPRVHPAPARRLLLCPADSRPPLVATDKVCAKAVTDPNDIPVNGAAICNPNTHLCAGTSSSICDRLLCIELH